MTNAPQLKQCPNCNVDQVVIYGYPNRLAGVCECMSCGASWSCAHESYEWEEHESEPVYIDHTIIYNTRLATCSECGIDISDRVYSGPESE